MNTKTPKILAIAMLAGIIASGCASRHHQHRHHAHKSQNNCARPPAYLQVKDFKKCLDTQDMGSWQSWCLPAEKPSHCPQASWQQLEKMDNIPACQQ